MYVALLDTKKAFDTVRRNGLMGKLPQLGVIKSLWCCWWLSYKYIPLCCLESDNQLGDKQIDTNTLTKKIFLNRLFTYIFLSEHKLYGFIPDAIDLFYKYNLSMHLYSNLQKGMFPSKHGKLLFTSLYRITLSLQEQIVSIMLGDIPEVCAICQRNFTCTRTRCYLLCSDFWN